MENGAISIAVHVGTIFPGVCSAFDTHFISLILGYEIWHNTCMYLGPRFGSHCTYQTFDNLSIIGSYKLSKGHLSFNGYSL